MKEKRVYYSNKLVRRQGRREKSVADSTFCVPAVFCCHERDSHMRAG